MDMASKKDSKTLIFVGLPIVLIFLVVGGYALFGSGDQAGTALPLSSQTSAAADDEFDQSDSPSREAGRRSSASSRGRLEGTASATLDDEGDEQLPTTAKKRSKRKKKRSRRKAQSEDEEEEATRKTGKALPPARPF